MAVYDVTRENGRTVVRKHHPFLRPFWNGAVIGFGFLLLLGSIAVNPPLGIALTACLLGVAWATHRQRS